MPTLSRFFRSFGGGITNLLFPRVCAVCRAPMDEPSVFEICGGCVKKFPQRPAFSCEVCGVPIDGEVAEAGYSSCGRCRITKPPFDATFYGMRYDGTARELVHRFKFGKIFRLAGAVASPLCAELYGKPQAREADVVAPVPLHRKRVFERSFNQSYLIALEIGKTLSIPVHGGLLARQRATTPQFSLSAVERHKNIKGAFAVERPELAEGKTVILVDDIMTTGSTMWEAAKTLKKAGAKKVICAASARA
ncbi:MAG: ComF family protein [Nitrospinae bacterium]|nr:ComF family protein [Nitrospinota bacterium]